MFRKLANRAAYGLFSGWMRSVKRYGEASDTSKKTMICRHGSHLESATALLHGLFADWAQRCHWVVGTPETSRRVRRRFWPDAHVVAPSVALRRNSSYLSIQAASHSRA
jgi:hypothetical protein